MVEEAAFESNCPYTIALSSAAWMASMAGLVAALMALLLEGLDGAGKAERVGDMAGCIARDRRMRETKGLEWCGIIQNSTRRMEKAWKRDHREIWRPALQYIS